MKTWTTTNGVSVTCVLAGRSCVFLVRNKNYALITDTGTRFEGRRLARRLIKLLSGQALSAIVLTHTHFDHAGNAAALKEAFKCGIMVHESEAGFLRDGYSPVPDGAVSATRFLNKLDKHKIRFFVKTRPVEPDVLIGKELDLGTFGIPVTLLHTPGHTRGSVSLIIDNDIAIVGDNMVNALVAKIFPPFCDDVPAMLESWNRLIATGCRLFLPMHGQEIPLDLLKKSYIIHTQKL